MKFPVIIFYLFSLIFSVYSKESGSLAEYVDPRIGTANDGSNCVIGPQLPFGSINPSPQTPNGSHDGYDSGREIRGFGQLHVSGTGWGKYGQIFVSPQTGLTVGESGHDSPKSGEKAHPYEYGVTLDRYKIRADFTPSFHSAIYRFVFPGSKNANILIDLSHNIPGDIALIGGKISEGKIRADPDNSKISGYGKYSGGFGSGEYTVYFSAIFSKDPLSSGTWKNGIVSNKNNEAVITKTNDRIGAFVKYHTVEKETVFMKIAVSFKSISQADAWLNKEIPAWDYDAVKNSARTLWNNELAKIRIAADLPEDKKIFYTAMYHAMLMPRNRTDDMAGFAAGVPVWDDHYAVWDTWRTLFPLMTLINPSMTAGNVNSFIERFKLNKFVRDAYIAGRDSPEEQGGNDTDNIIADAFVKGIAGVDWNRAYELIKNDADNERAGWQGWGNNRITDIIMGSYKKNGWIPAGIMSCSKSLEYSYNDYCAGQMALELGKIEDYKRYDARSRQWIQLWNPDAESDGFRGFIVPRNRDDTFVNIDLKKNWGSWDDYFYEGNSWTYSIFIPHEFQKLISISGGGVKYAEKLDHAFRQKLIDYSNEPAFLSSYTFIYAGRPDLTCYWTKKVLTAGFTLKGYPGNDDSGAMSSWYIFNAMGFFPNAGQDIYYLTGSIFPEVILQLEGNKRIVIETLNASKTNIYVQSCSLNGNIWNKAWLSHGDIKNGAVIKFEMGPNPSDWGQNDGCMGAKRKSY